MSDLKDKVILAIRNLPENASYEDIMDVVLVQEKIAKGLQQVQDGDVIPDEQMEKEFIQRQINRRKH